MMNNCPICGKELSASKQLLGVSEINGGMHLLGINGLQTCECGKSFVDIKHIECLSRAHELTRRFYGSQATQLATTVTTVE